MLSTARVLKDGDSSESYKFVILLWKQEEVEDDDRGFLSEFLSRSEFKTFVEARILLPAPLAGIKSHRINPVRNLREFKCSVDQIIQECLSISQFFSFYKARWISIHVETSFKATGSIFQSSATEVARKHNIK